MAGLASNRSNYGPMDMEKSPSRKKREAAAQQRQEQRWALQSGPVTTSFIWPLCGGAHARSDCPTQGGETYSVTSPAPGLAPIAAEGLGRDALTFVEGTPITKPHVR